MASRSLNKALIIGNLTRDPELRYTPNGNAVCSFSVATNSSWKDVDGNVKEVAEFHNVVAWNKLAEICSQILKSGMKVYIEGEIRTRGWEKDGVKHQKTEIRAVDMKALSPLSKSEDADVVDTGVDKVDVPETPEIPEDIDASIDDLPF
ncbi:single-stranded DNA-binding protein [Patescibacteria group bacterium]|nr:single-stranded DNA-binding protein [Patescibacteria group bacterium]